MSNCNLPTAGSDNFVPKLIPVFGFPGSDNKCRGCKTRPKPKPRPETYVASKSTSDLAFLGTGEPCNDQGDRVITYVEAPGTSFGAHLLRKSQPMISHNLSQKFKFKRDSETVKKPPNFISAKVGERPSFFSGLSLEKERRTVRGEDMEVKCPPIYQSNQFKSKFLTKEMAHRGIQYVQTYNVPRRPPPSPTRPEVQDPCGKIAHKPVLKGRDHCKLLCEAPSMTDELDYLFKEYVHRCAGDVNKETCRLLHHAPHPNEEERKRSILKSRDDPELQEFRFRKSRRSSDRDKRPTVQFDNIVENLGTITKVKGMRAALTSTPAKMKFLPQLNRRTAVSEWSAGDECAEERYPPHLKSLKKQIHDLSLPSSAEQDEHPGIDDDKMEGKIARQDLARIYFTNEATRLVACSQVGEWEASLNKRIIVPKRSPSLPHFFMERLAADGEAAKQQKEQAKLKKLKNELDQFDQYALGMPKTKVACSRFTPSWATSRFDPRQQDPEKSFIALKLKMEMLKLKRKKEVKATGNRYRCRKVYFRTMLPSMEVLELELMEYANGIIPRSSNPEKLFLKELEAVENHEMFQEYAIQFDPVKLERARDTKRAVGEVLDVLLENTLKIERYKDVTDEEPANSLEVEWREEDFIAIDEMECTAHAEMVKKHEQLAKDFVTVLIDVAVRSSEYKGETREEPTPTQLFDWRTESFAYLYGLECPWLDETQSASKQFIEGVLKTVHELVLRSRKFRAGYGKQPPVAMFHSWITGAFDFLTDPTCSDKAFSPDLGEQLALDLSKIMMDTAFKLKEFEITDYEDLPENMCQSWLEAGLDLDADCHANANETVEQVVADIIDIGLIDVAVKACEFKKAKNGLSSEAMWQDWRDDGFQPSVDEQCMEGIKEGVSFHKSFKSIVEIEVDVAMKASDYKSDRGKAPPKAMIEEWRDAAFNMINGLGEEPEQEQKSEDVARDILEVVFDVAMRSSEFKSFQKSYPPDEVRAQWRQEKYDEQDDPGCAGTTDGANSEVQLIKCVIKIVKEVAIKMSKYRSIMGVSPPESVYREWRDAAFEVFHKLDCAGKLNRKVMNDSLVADLVGIVLEVVVRMGELRALRWAQRPCAYRDEEEDEEKCIYVMTEQEETELISQQILDALVEVAIRVGDERARTGYIPTKEVTEDWLDQIFAAMDGPTTATTTAKTVTSKGVGYECRGKPMTDDDLNVADVHESQDVADNALDVLMDMAMKASGYRAATGRDPRQELLQEWMDTGFDRQYETICMRRIEEAFTSDRISRHIMEVLMEVAAKISDYKAENRGAIPTQLQIDQWYKAAYDSITVDDVINIMGEMPDHVCKAEEEFKASGLEGVCVKIYHEEEGETSVEDEIPEEVKRGRCGFFPLNLFDHAGRPVKEKSLPSECLETFTLEEATLCPSDESSSDESYITHVETIDECTGKKKEPPPPPPSKSSPFGSPRRYVGEREGEDSTRANTTEEEDMDEEEEESRPVVTTVDEEEERKSAKSIAK